MELADDNAHAARYLELRELLFPRGLSVLFEGYLYEAAEARSLRARLTPAYGDALRAVRVGATNLHDVVLRMLDAAERLGALEEKRADLEHAWLVEGHDAVSDVARVRLAWILSSRCDPSRIHGNERFPVRPALSGSAVSEAIGA